MSERLRSPTVDRVGRGAAIAALAIAGLVARLSATPVTALKAGGLACLIVAFVALLKAAEPAEAPARTPANGRRRSEAEAEKLAVLRVALAFALAAAGLLAASLLAARIVP